MARGHALGDVGNNFGNAADDIGRKDLIRMKHAQDLPVVVLFDHHKDCAATAKALRSYVHIGRAVLPGPDTIAIALDRPHLITFSHRRRHGRPK